MGGAGGRRISAHSVRTQRAPREAHPDFLPAGRSLGQSTHPPPPPTPIYVYPATPPPPPARVRARIAPAEAKMEGVGPRRASCFSMMIAGRVCGLSITIGGRMSLIKKRAVQRGRFFVRPIRGRSLQTCSWLRHSHAPRVPLSRRACVAFQAFQGGCWRAPRVGGRGLGQLSPPTRAWVAFPSTRFVAVRPPRALIRSQQLHAPPVACALTPRSPGAATCEALFTRYLLGDG